MDKIAGTTSLIKGIVEVYDQTVFQEDLKGTMEILCSKFADILSDSAQQYRLISANSVRPIKYFHVKGRVKESDSFHEKMIRSNMIYNFLSIKNYNSKKEITRKKSEVQNVIKEISDDIIGIKVLTQVDADCKKVFSLLKDKHLELFSDKRNIYLNPDDMERQPARMRNGFEFYKIRGVYNTSYQFELQIKSELLSVWGDMDHSMFYKDYSVSPIKQNVKESMIHLGSLISQVDRFLLQIRESESTFSKNREVIDFTEEFSTNYSKLFKAKLGFGYRLEEIAEYLFFLYQQLPEKKKRIRARLDYSLLSHTGGDALVRQYKKIRDKDFNLKIIELIYFNWFSSFYTDKKRKRDNFNLQIPKLLARYLEFLVLHLSDKMKFYTPYLERNFNNIFIALSDGSLLYNFEKLDKFFETLKDIETFSDFDIKYEKGEDEKDKIRNFLMLVFYGQDALAYIKTTSNDDFIQNIIITLNNVKFPYSEKKLEELHGLKKAEDLIKKSLILLKDN